MTDRVDREKHFFNNEEWTDIRVEYAAKFGHAEGSGYYTDYRKQLAREVMKNAKGKDVLELGATWWVQCINFDFFAPAHLTCINISDAELSKGVALYESIVCNNEKEILTNIEFKIMDAHKLDFGDESIDVVFGAGILHHLEFDTALKEIHRVLKPDGFCLFVEPLGANPIGKLVRKRTPEARTADEKPLGKVELATFSEYFKVEYIFLQLFSVPAGVISAKIFKTPYNKLMKLAFIVDIFINKVSPMWFKRLFRHVHIVGYKQG